MLLDQFHHHRWCLVILVAQENADDAVDAVEFPGIRTGEQLPAHVQEWLVALYQVVNELLREDMEAAEERVGDIIADCIDDLLIL